MAIKYQWNQMYQGRAVSAVYITGEFIGADEADRYMIPNVTGGFSCNGCMGFHFSQNRSYSSIQFNDRASWDALTCAFPVGTFQQFGTFQGQDVGSGTGTLTISEYVGGIPEAGSETGEAGCC